MPIVTASSFADPSDVRAFDSCIAKGGTQEECFKVGDNGIGKWGDQCATETECLCALPREDWEERWGTTGDARLKPINVTYKGKTITGRLADTMPSRAHIKNGAGLDLNPGFAKAFGEVPPFMLKDVEWNWA